MKNLEEFQVEPEMISYLGLGGFGEVYRLTPPHAGKFLWYGDGKRLKIEQLQREKEIAKIAYEERISVPKPEGVFKVRHPKNRDMQPALIMEYIEGLTLKDIYRREKESVSYYKVLRLAKEEIEKANKTKLIPAGDAVNSGNIIWCPEKEKVYLIDFGLWEVIE